MTVQARRIRSAIQGVLEGVIGSVDTRIAAGKFVLGVFDGQPKPAKQANSIGQHGFDVQLRPLSDHPAGPVSALTTQPIQSLAVTIPIWTHVATTAQVDDREALLAELLDDGDEACIALGYPHNLDADQFGGPTFIVGGLMCGPGGDGRGRPVVDPTFTENWSDHYVISQITGSLIVSPAA